MLHDIKLYPTELQVSSRSTDEPSATFTRAKRATNDRSAASEKPRCAATGRRTLGVPSLGLLFGGALGLMLASAGQAQSLSQTQSQRQSNIEETIVTATLQAEDLERTSITVIDSTLIAQRSAQHLEDLLSAAPNTNFASGASRGRFIQIRGIGERSQFVEPVNSSVAILLDGIDLTGLGGAATTWDLEQIEILRGPQGTLMGANALAGLINLRSTPAESGEKLRLSAGIENYGGYRLGVAAGTRLSDNWQARLAVQQYASDGYIDNTWLGTDDTNHRDELTGRLGIRWSDDRQQLDIGLYRIDVDNGYDGFSLDNTRETLSDQPGRDALATNAGRVRYERTGFGSGSGKVMAQLSIAKTDTDYSYDEDWSYVGIAPDWEYSSFDEYLRDRDMQSLELRTEDEFIGGYWVAGVYLRREQESLVRNYTYLASPFESELDIDTQALFGQIDIPISDTVGVYAGGRVERRATDYRDNTNVDETVSDTLWSGRAGIEAALSENHSVYLGINRGVRSGGINANLLASLPSLPGDIGTPFLGLGTFDEESLLNIELGWRWSDPDAGWQSDVTLFQMQRRDQQVRRSLAIPRDDGSTAFFDYTDNAAEGTNRGLEWQASWKASDTLTLSASLGLLDAAFDDYVTALGEDFSGRQQPQAPDVMGQLAVQWQATTNLDLGAEFTGMDSYFFSDRHDTRSPSRQLINAHIGWQQVNWRLVVWGRNLGNETYFVRGFGSFGNDPRKEYAVEPYYQYGEPRVVGATVEYQI